MAAEKLRLLRIAETHAGYVTIRQARAAGVDVQRSDDWIPVREGIFRLAGWPGGPFDEFAMWSGYFDDAAVMSHQTAAELHGIGTLHPRFVHMTASVRLPAPRHVSVHTAALGPDDTERVGAFAVTTPVRTVLDLAAGGIAVPSLREVVADAVAIGRLSVAEVLDRVSELTERGAQRLVRALT